MVEHRWQIIIGAGILILMLLTAAFSFGVYVGRYGWSVKGLARQPGFHAVPQPKPAGQNQAPPQGNQRPDLLGRIWTISEDALELLTQDGPRLIRVTSDTRVVDLSGTELSLSQLKRDDNVAVYGQRDITNDKVLLAIRIVRLPLQTNPNHPQDKDQHPDILGQIRHIEEDTIRLATEDGPQLVEISPETRIEDLDGAKLLLPQLNIGDGIAVYGKLDASGDHWLATSIVRLPPLNPSPR